MVHEAKRRVAAAGRVLARAHQRGVRAVGGGRWAFVGKWTDPKFAVPLIVALMAQRTGCRAEKGNEQVATSVVAVMRDQTAGAGTIDSLRLEVGSLKLEVGRLADRLRVMGAGVSRPGKPGETAAPTTQERQKPLNIITEPAKALWSGVRWLFSGGT